MILIKVSDDVLINPEKISVVETRKIRGTTTYKVTVDGKPYLVEVPPEEFLRDLIKSGVEAHAQFFSV